MADQSRPNILVFFTDQQRWDTCGCYGQPLDTTPNLDRMAGEGTRYKYAFTCQPVCGPARASIQTGLYATQTGCYVNNIALALDADTIAKRMSQAGYEVGYIGKWHLASTGDQWLKKPADREVVDHKTVPVPEAYRGGYKDHWVAADVPEFTSTGYDGFMYDSEGNKLPIEGYRVDTQTRWVTDYLNNRKTDKPFFLFVSYLEPHHQNTTDRYEGPAGSKERWSAYSVPGDLQDTEGDWRENYPDYLGCVNALDQGLGRIMALLEAQGELDNTVILFTSDHGSHFKTRNREYKRSCHESSIRIPMVAHGPGFEGGHVSAGFASLLDIAPTVLHAAGLPVPDHMAGRPLQQAAASVPADWRCDVYIQISEHEHGRALRTDRWTYAVTDPQKDGWESPFSDHYVESYLYDNQNDPHQKNNLVADPSTAEIRSVLRQKMLAYIQEVEQVSARIDVQQENRN